MPSYLKVIVLACLIAGLMGAQALPSNTTSTSSVCGTHEVFVYGQFNCIGRYHLPWFADGAGWNSRFVATNTTSENIMVNLNLVESGGVDATNILFGSHIKVYGNLPLQMNDATMIGNTIQLSPGQTAEIEMQYPRICQSLTSCSAQPNQLQVGSIAVTVETPDGQTLDDQQLKAIHLLFKYTAPATGLTTLQVPLEIINDATALSKWETDFTETALALKSTDVNSETTSFAVLNIGMAQPILVEILDENGLVSNSRIIPVLAIGAVHGASLIDLFGEGYLGDTQQDGHIHGRLRFTGMNGGSIALFTVKSAGQSLSFGFGWGVK